MHHCESWNKTCGIIVIQGLSASDGFHPVVTLFRHRGLLFILLTFKGGRSWDRLFFILTHCKGSNSCLLLDHPHPEPGEYLFVQVFSLDPSITYLFLLVPLLRRPWTSLESLNPAQSLLFHQACSSFSYREPSAQANRWGLEGVLLIPLHFLRPT